MTSCTENCFKRCLVLALSLVVLGMCWRTVDRFLVGGTTMEVTVKMIDQIPSPSITICSNFKHGIAKQDLLFWEEFPEDFMGTSIKYWNR